MLLEILAATDPTSLFDPSTQKIGGVLILTVHLTIMAQVKKIFFGTQEIKYKALKKGFDFLNYPLAFIECLLVVPPWPLYDSHAWGIYTGASIGLAVVASVTAQKVRDTDTDTKETSTE